LCVPWLNSFRSGTPVASDIVVDPSVEFKPVERHPLAADWHRRDVRPDFRVEAVAIHAEIAGRVAKSDQARQH